LKDTIQNRKGFVWVERHIDIQKAKELKKSVPEIDFHIEDARFYPEGTMLAGFLGLTGVDNQGLEGLEYYADKLLAGTEIQVNTVKDSRGRLILFDDSIIKTQPDSALYLTVNSQLQATADRILKTDRQQFKAKRAIALAIDVQTGEILLFAVSETGNKVSKKNLATTYLFEPGSIFKAASFGYLIESGMYRAGDKVNTSRPVSLHGHEIKDVYMYQSLTQQEIFTKSSNIGTVTLTQKVNSTDFYNFLQKAGFGSKIGLEAMTEESGVLRSPDRWSGLSKASISIGHEVLVSPMQMVRFYAAIANNGIAVTPSIVDRYESPSGTKRLKKESTRIFSENTAKTLMGMMQDTVETGTGRRARTGILDIAGKTGTAQVALSTGGYSKEDYVASFAGVFPAENPRVAMIVIYETNVRSAIYGGETSATTFRKIAEQVAFFYDIGNDKTRVQYANH
jgi:cell division protein FtsI (penicillin-binding protein 3)